METPICDFVREYAESEAMRLHMPGHKGVSFLGFEARDITEIDGADALYQASGIIKRSEENASSLFGCHTYYSTEGTSQCVRAMLYLMTVYAKKQGRKPIVLAARNVHKVFLDAVALLDVDVEWLYPAQHSLYVSCVLSATQLDRTLHDMAEKPTAVYVTSPDYLGNITDIAALASVCHRYGVMLLVDNAHGAYLRFLSPSQHPIDLGADLCCDSAHKTLPVLTGGAYLHIAQKADSFLCDHAKDALSLFGSTSPSYLILQSLDAANRYLHDGYAERLSSCVTALERLKERLTEHGYVVCGNEPLKIVLQTKAYGYIGTEFARILAKRGVVCEFADRDFVVCMLTPENANLAAVEAVLCDIPKQAEIDEPPPAYHRCEWAFSVREAMLAPCETVAVENSIGRILASSSVGCPPAVPIVVCGEKIDRAAVLIFQYYGITHINVVM